MRGVVMFFLTLFTVVVMMLFAPPMIEGVGEDVKDFDTVDSDDAGTIDEIYVAVFRWIPMVLIIGFGVWGIAWYVRRNRVIGRRPPP